MLNGEKRYIGNGSRADVLTTFARCEVDGKDRHIALLVEKGMKGFEVGDRYDTMGLRANDLRRLKFNDVRIPPENVLGEPGEGFRIAMAILNNGRIGLGTGSVGGAKMLIDMAIKHVTEREQFGAPLADLELVQEKIGWMVSYLFGVESMCYLTTGLVDRGVEDYSLESAMCKIAGTEFLWYQVNRALQLAGGEGYMRTRALREDPARHPDLPDLRGRQRRAALVRRAQRPEAGRREALGPRQHRPRRSGRLARRAGRLRRRAHPPGQDHDGRTRALDRSADAVTEQVKRLRSISEKLLREHRGEIIHKGLHHRRLSDALADIYAQIAVISRVTALFDEQGVEASGQERHIARSFCKRAERRVNSHLDQIERNDDEHITAIAKLAYKRGSYGYALCD